MLEGQKIADAYTGIDVLAVPSYEENFGMNVVESLLQGTHVIVSEGVALKDWVRENNVGRVLPLDVDAWAKELAGLDKKRHSATMGTGKIEKGGDGKFFGGCGREADAKALQENSLGTEQMKLFKERTLLFRRNEDMMLCIFISFF